MSKIPFLKPSQLLSNNPSRPCFYFPSKLDYFNFRPLPTTTNAVLNNIISINFYKFNDGEAKDIKPPLLGTYPDCAVLRSPQSALQPRPIQLLQKLELDGASRRRHPLTKNQHPRDPLNHVPGDLGRRFPNTIP